MTYRLTSLQANCLYALILSFLLLACILVGWPNHAKLLIIKTVLLGVYSLIGKRIIEYWNEEKE